MAAARARQAAQTVAGTVLPSDAPPARHVASGSIDPCLSRERRRASSPHCAVARPRLFVAEQTPSSIDDELPSVERRAGRICMSCSPGRSPVPAECRRRRSADTNLPRSRRRGQGQGQKFSRRSVRAIERRRRRASTNFTISCAARSRPRRTRRRDSCLQHASRRPDHQRRRPAAWPGVVRWFGDVKGERRWPLPMPDANALRSRAGRGISTADGSPPASRPPSTPGPWPDRPSQRLPDHTTGRRVGQVMSSRSAP